MKIKVCGMRDGDNIREVAALGVDYIGMIFWNGSPRNVTMLPTHAGIIPDRASLSPLTSHPSPLPSHPSPLTSHPSPLTSHPSPQRVGVFVDEMPQNIITRVVNFHLDVIQMHGYESATVIRNLRATLDPDIRPGIQFWKAISIATADDLALCRQYEDCVDAFVFDTHSPSVGGSGQQFDWHLLDNYDGPLPFLLSGGIGPDDTERIKAFHHPKCIGIDLNSRFETAPAVKDVALLSHFLDSLR